MGVVRIPSTVAAVYGAPPAYNQDMVGIQMSEELARPSLTGTALTICPSSRKT